MGLLNLGKMPPVVSPHVSVMESVQRMVELKTGAVAVTEGDKLLGVFTERDLMSRVVARGKDPSSTPISEVMTRNVYSVTDHTPVAEAVAMMRANNFRHLPVVDEEGRIRGMVALRYLLYHIMDGYEIKMHDLERFMMEDSRGG